MNHPDAPSLLDGEGIPVDTIAYKMDYRRRMAKHGITQRVLCDHMGYDHSRISKWLRPEYDLMFSTMQRMEKMLAAVIRKAAS